MEQRTRYMFRKQPFVSEWNHLDPLDGRDAPLNEELLCLTQDTLAGVTVQEGGRAAGRPSCQQLKQAGAGRWVGALQEESYSEKCTCTRILRTRVLVSALPPGLGPSSLWTGFSFLLCKGEGCTTPSPAPKASFPGTTTQMSTAVVSSQGNVASQETRQCHNWLSQRGKGATATGIGDAKDRDAKHLKIHQTSPPTKGYLEPNVNSAKVEEH